MDLTTPTLAAALGWTAGMRSATAPALLSRALSSGRRPQRQPAAALAGTWAPRLLTAAAGGEMVADKMPGMPPRTDPPALAGRIASGALVGAAVAAARHSSLVPAALAGAAGAVAASYTMVRLRTAASTGLGVPDTAVALVEDALTLILGHRVVEAAVGR